MSTDEHRTLMEQFGAAMDRKDAAFMAAHPGLTDSLALYQQLWAAFPDLQDAAQESISEGAWCAQRVLVSGTMQGAFLGLPPTGQQATWEVIQTFRIVAGTIVECHGQADVLGMLQHLGLGPVPGPASR
jgi:predicted ester cyclase